MAAPPASSPRSRLPLPTANHSATMNITKSGWSTKPATTVTVPWLLRRLWRARGPTHSHGDGWSAPGQRQQQQPARQRLLRRGSPTADEGGQRSGTAKNGPPDPCQRNGDHPGMGLTLRSSLKPSPPGGAIVVLADGATDVLQAAVASGMYGQPRSSVRDDELRTLLGCSSDWNFLVELGGERLTQPPAEASR